MIEHRITEVLQRKCPSYHTVPASIAKDAFSLCTCGKCRFSVLGTNVARTKPERTCKPLLDRLIEDGLPIGYARVDNLGTCDRARFEPEDNRDFRLQCETAVVKMCKRNGERPEDEPVFRGEEGNEIF